MKVFVTGSNGFVGNAVCEELRRKKYAVVEYDQILGHNILDKFKLKQKMKGANAIIHLAAIVENNNPALWEVNVEGTRNVVDAAISAKVKKVIFLSSTGVYGFTKSAVSEKTLPKPENNYEKSKVEGEKIILDAARNGKIEACVLRSAMIFGANNYWKNMFSMLEKKFPLPCNGNNKYQIIYVKELASAISTVLEKGKNGELYLAAGKEKPTLNEFCKMTQEEMKLETKLGHLPSWIALLIGKIGGIKLLTSENIRHISKERNYDTRKIEKLGFRQKIGLKKAINEVVKETRQGKK